MAVESQEVKQVGDLQPIREESGPCAFDDLDVPALAAQLADLAGTHLQNLEWQRSQLHRMMASVEKSVQEQSCFTGSVERIRLQLSAKAGGDRRCTTLPPPDKGPHGVAPVAGSPRQPHAVLSQEQPRADQTLGHDGNGSEPTSSLTVGAFGGKQSSLWHEGRMGFPRSIPKLADEKPSRRTPRYRKPAPPPNSDFDDLRNGAGDDLAKRYAVFRLIERLVLSTRFELVMGIIILVYMLVIALETQDIGREAGWELGYFQVTKPDPTSKETFEVVNDVFLVVFVCEVLLRMTAQRLNWARNGWNWFDLALVLSSGYTKFFGGLGFDSMILRIVRLSRLFRSIRMFKGLRIVDSWDFISKAMSASKTTLFWSLLLLFLIKATAAILVCQSLSSYFNDGSVSEQDRTKVFKYWGTFTKSLISMFEVTHANYSNSLRVILDNVAEEVAWGFLLYRMLVTWAMLNVIRAVFIQQTLQVAENDEDLMISAKARQLKRDELKLTSLFYEMDEDSSGDLNAEQFRNALESPQMKTWISALDISVRDSDKVFHLIDADDKGGVSLPEFIRGASQLRGFAKALDLLELKDMIQSLERRLAFLPLEPSSLPAGNAVPSKASYFGEMAPVLSAEQPMLPFDEQDSTATI